MGGSIFLADADPVALRKTGVILEQEGYNVLSFTNEEEVLRAVNESPPDLLVLALSNKTRAYDLCRRLKSNNRTNNVTILLSGPQRQIDVLLDGIDCGADGFLTKPFKQDEVLAKIKAFIRLNKNHRDLLRSNQVLEEREKELFDRNLELERLYDLTKALVQPLDIKMVLETLTEKCRELFQADRCFIQLFSENAQETTGLIGLGAMDCDWLRPAIPISDESFLVRQILAEAQPVFIKVAKNSPLVNKRLAYGFGLKSVLAVPLMLGRTVKGIMLICREKIGSFSQEQLRLASILGREAAAAVDRAALYERTQEMQATLRAIVEWSDSGIMFVDNEERIITTNRKFNDLFFFGPEALKGQANLDDFISHIMPIVRDPDVFQNRLKWLHRHSQEVLNDVFDTVHPVPRTLERFSGPVFDAAGEVIGRVDIYRDITAKRQSERRIRKLYRRERKIAQILQKNLLPQSIPKMKKVDFGAKYAAAVEGMVIGGDYFDFIKLDKGLGIAVGDVCGKGMSAAVLTYLVKYSLRAFARENADPGVVMTRLNLVFAKEVEEGAFVSMVYLLLDDDHKSLSFSVAGHPTPIIYRKREGGCSLLGRSVHQGAVIGVVPETRYVADSVKIGSGDVVVLYTDGIIEARSPAGFFGEERLKEVISENAGAGAQEIADAIFKAASNFSNNHLNDDAVVVAIKKL